MSLLPCQSDSYRRSSDSVVLSCTKAAPLPDTSEASDSFTAPVEVGELYEVLLSDCIFYAEGGGQPSDCGTVNGYNIRDVCREHVDSPNIVVVVNLPAPFSVGATVHCEVDWVRRYDFMQQHTAQHLFSAVAHKLLGADTEGWALGSEDVTVDLTLSAASDSSRGSGKAASSLGMEQLAVVEKEVNAMIRQGCAVDWHVYPQEEIAEMMKAMELEQQQQKKEDNAEQPTSTTSTKTATTTPTTTTNNSGAAPPSSSASLLRGAPKGAALLMSQLRMVRIAGLDLNPCGGTHLRGVGELQLLKLSGCERERGGVRVHFLAGQRAVAALGACLQREQQLSVALSAPPRQHAEAVSRVLREKRELLKRFEAAEDELAVYLGTALARANKTIGDNSKSCSSTTTATTLATTELSTEEGASAATTTSSLPCPVIALYKVGVDLKFLLKAVAAAREEHPAAVVFLCAGEEPLLSGGGGCGNSKEQDRGSSVKVKGGKNPNGGKSKSGNSGNSKSISSNSYSGAGHGDVALPNIVPPPPLPLPLAPAPNSLPSAQSDSAAPTGASAAAPRNDTESSPVKTTKAAKAVKAVPGPWVLFGDRVFVEAVKPELLGSPIEARGGGRPGCMQGQAAHLEHYEHVHTLLVRHWWEQQQQLSNVV